MQRGLIVAMLVFLGISLGGADSVQSPRPLSIGVLVPLTGGPAEQGQWILQGVELAKKKALEEGVNVDLHIEETQADPKTAISAFQRLRTTGPLDALITYGSGVGMALSPLSNQFHVVQMGVATSTPAYRSAEDFTFRNFPSAEIEAEFVVKKAIEIAAGKEIALVRVNNEYGLGVAKAFQAAMQTAGAQVLAEELLDPAASDYRQLIIRLKTKKPAAIFLASYPIEGALFLKQSKELDFQAPVLSSVAILGAKNFFDLAAGGSEGLLVASSIPAYTHVSSQEVRDFLRLYRETYKTEPSVEHLYAARAYDGLRALLRADQGCKGKADTGRAECLRDGLFQLAPADGPSGLISFDRNGDVGAEFRWYEMRGKKFFPLPG